MRPRLSAMIETYPSRAVPHTCPESLDAAVSMPQQRVGIDNPPAKEPWNGCAHRPDVRVIGNPDHRGFARAVHQGLEQATGETVLLLNPDDRVSREGIERLLETSRDRA